MWANGVAARKLEVRFSELLFWRWGTWQPYSKCDCYSSKEQRWHCESLRGNSVLFLVNLSDLKMWEYTVNSRKDCERPSDNLVTELLAN
jgi:hypothetical protein